jgi:hypothetical protein
MRDYEEMLEKVFEMMRDGWKEEIIRVWLDHRYDSPDKDIVDRVIGDARNLVSQFF